LPAHTVLMLLGCWGRGIQAGSGAGCHEGAEDVVRVAVQVLAARSHRIVVRGSAWRAAIWTSRKSTPASSMFGTNVAEHVRVCSGDPDVGGSGEPAQAAGGRVPVRPGAAAVEEAGPQARRPIAWSMARPTAGGSGTRTILVPLPRAAPGGRALPRDGCSRGGQVYSVSHSRIQAPGRVRLAASGRVGPRLTQAWEVYDEAGMWRQLGVLPPDAP
jgi:hypothetical protein